MKLNEFAIKYGSGFGYNLAKFLGVTPGAVYQWLSGAREIPERRKADIRTFLVCNGLLQDSGSEDEFAYAEQTPSQRIPRPESLSEVRVAS